MARGHRSPRNEKAGVTRSKSCTRLLGGGRVPRTRGSDLHQGHSGTGFKTCAEQAKPKSRGGGENSKGKCQAKFTLGGAIPHLFRRDRDQAGGSLVETKLHHITALMVFGHFSRRIGWGSVQNAHQTTTAGDGAEGRRGDARHFPIHEFGVAVFKELPLRR